METEARKVRIEETKRERKKKRRRKKREEKKEKPKKERMIKESDRRMGNLGWRERSNKVGGRSKRFGTRMLSQVDSYIWKETK